MATASHIQLSTADAGIFHVPNIQQDAAERTSQVLQENHDKYHIFFDGTNGLHNHTVHHVLTAYALGASAQAIQMAYDNNKEYQREANKKRDYVTRDLHDRTKFVKHLSELDHYSEFLEFFHNEIEKKGVAKTIQQHVFAGDEMAEAMLKRLPAGFFHPVIHVGFGLDFNQPAIVAEGLAEAACSSSWTKDLLDAVEEHIAQSSKSDHFPDPEKSLFDLQAEILDTPTLVKSVDWAKTVRIRDGILKSAPTEMAKIASQWRVKPSDLERKTAEMINFCAYITGASMNPRKQIVFDFFYMHAMNASMFYSKFLTLEWLTDSQKCRLLEMKGWVDLNLYVAQGSPKLLINEITEYKPKIPGDWTSIVGRINSLDTDDCHMVKLIRALMHGERASKPFEEQYQWPVQGNSWLQLGHMVMDSIEQFDPKGLDAVFSRWTRGSGFPQAWVKYAERGAVGAPTKLSNPDVPGYSLEAIPGFQQKADQKQGEDSK